MKEIMKNKLIKGLLISVLLMLILYIIFIIIYKAYCEGEMTEAELNFVITSIKNIFQTLFFCLIAVITILSYMQARKTLFTPIKTETFKMQIAAFEEILAFFQTKTESDFTDQFDFDFIFKSNARLMFSAYIKAFFKDDIKLNEEALSELRSNFVGGIATKSFADEHFEKPEYYEKIEEKKRDSITNPAIILNKWKKYEYGMTEYSKKFYEENEKLNKLRSSPLIPSELIEKLEDFARGVSQHLITVGEVLTEISQELPDKFPSADSLEQFELDGLWNIYNARCDGLEPMAKDILTYIRQYLGIDDLIK